MGGGATVSTVFGNSMFGCGSGAEVIDVVFAVNGSARILGEGDEEATEMLYWRFLLAQPETPTNASSR
jgi:hypothetical protein